MVYIGDKEYWNKKFINRNSKPLKPETTLVDNIKYLKKEKVLLNKDNLKDIKIIYTNGILFISGFGHKHKVDKKIRKEDLIQPSDFDIIKDSFDLIKYTENKNDRGYFITYIFRKK